VPTWLDFQAGARDQFWPDAIPATKFAVVNALNIFAFHALALLVGQCIRQGFK